MYKQYNITYIFLPFSPREIRNHYLGLVYLLVLHIGASCKGSGLGGLGGSTGKEGVGTDSSKDSYSNDYTDHGDDGGVVGA